MKRSVACGILLLAILCVLGNALSEAEPKSSPLPERIDIWFFYEEACGSCDGTEVFIELLSVELGEVKGEYPYALHFANVFTTAGREAFERTLVSFGHSTVNLSFPVLMINSKLFSGLEAIEKNLKEAFWVAGEDIFTNGYVYNAASSPEALFDGYAVDPAENTLVYFYRLACEECNAVRPFVEGLPEAVEVNGVLTDTRVLRLNTRSGNNNEKVRKFFTAYDVPEADQSVPIVFIGDRYLSGQEAIEAGLEALLTQGAGLNFVFPE